MGYNLLLVLSNTFLLVGACVAFIMPLRRRENWWRWLPVGFALLVLTLVLGYHSDGLMIFVYYLITYLLTVLLVNRTTELSPADGCYCAVWIFMTATGVEEIWLALHLHYSGSQMLDPLGVVQLLVFSTLVFLILSRTVARWMPRGDVYQVSASQLLSGLVLGGMFVALSYLFLLPQNQKNEERLLIVLCQVCCLSLLFVQTEVSKRKHAERQVDILNLLCSFGAQQYHTALQNVRAVNQKCEELEGKCLQMEQYLPPEFRQEAKQAVDDARKACDTVVKSGCEVLDIVLTEKNLLAESSHAQINCVADGKLLGFMEVVDIYALFTYALEIALEAVGELADESHRLVDLLVCENQNFLVINLTHPITAASYRRKGSLNMYKIMVVRRIVEKYHGMHTIERQDDRFTLKLLIPLAQNK